MQCAYPFPFSVQPYNHNTNVSRETFMEGINMPDFYDGTKLLSLMDINKNRPEIYISTSNRSAGKTTYFNKLAFNKWLKGSGKFMLLYRFNYELTDVAQKYFGDIRDLFFPNYELEAKSLCKGKIMELTVGDETCGYAVCLNDADIVKKFSHMFKDVVCIVFDEFQSETDKYCSQEIRKFISIHQSVARGGGKQSRYVPVYMIGNFVSILNPYFVSLGISKRLQEETNFMRGKGWVFEQCYNESASKALRESSFNQAFEDTAYVRYSTQKVYLNDNKSFVEKMTGAIGYYATMIVNGKPFAINEHYATGCMYVNHNVDHKFPMRITASVNEHDATTRMIARGSSLIFTMRQYFDNGMFRFKDLECKQATLQLLAYI